MTLTEENYLKALHRLSMKEEAITVKRIAQMLNIKMPTVNSMINNLADKKLIKYEKYKSIELTEKGRKQALLILRKHRLTELFLKDVMGLGWEEVHDIAEQIEHLQSDLFFNRIDEMLGHPKFDPHGEPIPDSNGRLPQLKSNPLSHCAINIKYQLSGVLNNEASFLTYLNSLDLSLGSSIEITHLNEFDKSMGVKLNGKSKTVFSALICQNLLVV